MLDRVLWVLVLMQKAKLWASALLFMGVSLLPGRVSAITPKEAQTPPVPQPAHRPTRLASANIWALVDTYAKKYGIPLYIARNVAHYESGGRQNAVSSRGARGVMQLMPATARALGVNPNDPRQNIEGGMRHLRGLHNRFKRWDYAIAAYHAGPGAVVAYHGIPPYPETQRYVATILGRTGSRPSAQRTSPPPQSEAKRASVPPAVSSSAATKVSHAPGPAVVLNDAQTATNQAAVNGHVPQIDQLIVKRDQVTVTERTIRRVEEVVKQGRVVERHEEIITVRNGERVHTIREFRLVNGALKLVKEDTVVERLGDYEDDDD